MQRMNGQRLMNVLHYRLYVSGASIVDGDDIIPEFHDTFFSAAGGPLTLLKAISSSAWTYESTVYQWIHPVRYTSTGSVVGAGAGGVAGTSLPQNVQATITKQAVIATRHGIGAMHIGGLPSSAVVAGMLSEGYKAGLAELAVALITDVDVSAVANALTLDPVILRKDAPALSYEYGGATVQNTARVQRRRTVGVGE